MAGFIFDHVQFVGTHARYDGSVTRSGKRLAGFLEGKVAEELSWRWEDLFSGSLSLTVDLDIVVIQRSI